MSICEAGRAPKGEDCWVVEGAKEVNRVDEGLGQPRQVMTAGTHGPSGRLIFDM